MLLTVCELYFLHLILNNQSEKQNKGLLKTITGKQYNLLRKIACCILDETIVLSTSELRKLQRYKNIIRKLAAKKASGNNLSNNLILIKQLAQIAIKEYEICTKSYSPTIRRVGKNKKQNIKTSSRNRNSFKRSKTERDQKQEDSTENESSSSEDNNSSTEESKESEESEEEDSQEENTSEQTD